MQDWDALKYFLINLGLHNLALVLVAAGLGVLLGRLLWARSAQGLVQLRERVAAEEDRANEAERALEEKMAKYEDLRSQLDKGEGGSVVINSPELEEELVALRRRSQEADGTLEQMLLANQALEGVVKELEGQKSAWEDAGTTGQEHDEAELAGLRAEIEVLRGESKTVQKERDGLTGELEKVRKELLKGAKKAKKSGKGGKGGDAAMTERVAALELQLLEARNERKQVEEASAILRKELYGMRHKLEEVEKRENLEKELDQALQDAEQRLTRLQGEVTASARRRKGLEDEVKGAIAQAAAPEMEEPQGEEPEDVEEDEVVKLTRADEVGEDDDFDDEEDSVVATEVESEPEPEEEVEEDEPEDGESEAEPELPDDLTKLKGVGAVLAKRLNDAGVLTFQQMADWTEEEVTEISKSLALQNRVKSGDWQGQAKALCQKPRGEDN